MRCQCMNWSTDEYLSNVEHDEHILTCVGRADDLDEFRDMDLRFANLIAIREKALVKVELLTFNGSFE